VLPIARRTLDGHFIRAMLSWLILATKEDRTAPGPPAWFIAVNLIQPGASIREPQISRRPPWALPASGCESCAVSVRPQNRFDPIPGNCHHAIVLLESQRLKRLVVVMA